MIVVRRIVLNRLPQYSRPAKNSAPPIASPTLIWIGPKPPISAWSANFGFGSFTSWKIVWVVNRPSTALMAIHVGASSQTWPPRRISR